VLRTAKEKLGNLFENPQVLKSHAGRQVKRFDRLTADKRHPEI